MVLIVGLLLITYVLSQSCDILTQEHKDEIVRLHNAEREKYCLPPIKWDDDVAELATRIASNCYPYFGFLENYGMNTQGILGDQITGEKLISAVDRWLSYRDLWSCGECLPVRNLTRIKECSDKLEYY